MAAIDVIFPPPPKPPVDGEIAYPPVLLLPKEQKSCHPNHKTTVQNTVSVITISSEKKGHSMLWAVIILYIYQSSAMKCVTAETFWLQNHFLSYIFNVFNIYLLLNMSVCLQVLCSYCGRWWWEHFGEVCLSHMPSSLSLLSIQFTYWETSFSPILSNQEEAEGGWFTSCHIMKWQDWFYFELFVFILQETNVCHSIPSTKTYSWCYFQLRLSIFYMNLKLGDLSWIRFWKLSH